MGVRVIFRIAADRTASKLVPPGHDPADAKLGEDMSRASLDHQERFLRARSRVQIQKVVTPLQNGLELLRSTKFITVSIDVGAVVRPEETIEVMRDVSALRRKRKRVCPRQRQGAAHHLPGAREEVEQQLFDRVDAAHLIAVDSTKQYQM